MKFLNLIIWIWIIFCATHCVAQNIIVNPSFEDTIQANFGIIRAKGWSSPTQGSPDLMDSLSRPEYHVPQNQVGYQFAQDSSRYFGLVLFSKNRINLREYIQSELNHKLIEDSAYCFQFFISLGDSSNYAIKNNLGIYFSTQSFNREGTFVLNNIPQIELIDAEYFVEKVAWVKYSAQYIAAGDEKFITIGNFRDNSNLDTLNIGGGGDQPWHRVAYYYIDNLYLGHCDSIPEDSSIGLREYHLKKRSILVYPNPTKEQVTIAYTVEKDQLIYFELYDVLGKKQSEQQLTEGSLHKMTFTQMHQGVYIYRLTTDNELLISGKLVIE